MSRVFPIRYSGPGVSRAYAGGMAGDETTPSQSRVKGAALGLPAEGPGSIAPFGTRAVAFVVDVLVAAVAAGLVLQRLPQNWSLLAFGVITVASLVLAGRTPGHALLGLQLAHPRQGQRVALWRAVVRTGLLMVLVPALVVDGDGRGLHDRLTQTAVIRRT